MLEEALRRAITAQQEYWKTLRELELILGKDLDAVGIDDGDLDTYSAEDLRKLI